MRKKSVAPPRSITMARNCTSQNLKYIKLFAFSIIDVSRSLSRIKHRIKKNLIKLISYLPLGPSHFSSSGTSNSPFT